MPAPKFADLKPEYTRLWASLTITRAKAEDVEATARRIIGASARYVEVQNATGVPWYVVGLIHAMECGLSFNGHLHNGDSLRGKTRQVPKGRPTEPPSAGEGKPYTWFESACDAIHYDGLDRIKDWSIERICYELEAYNGWGSRWKGIATPYLWSGTQHYTRGKYVADHVWSATAVSGQSGAMAILKRMMELDKTVVVGPVKKTVVETIGKSPSLRIQINQLLVAAGTAAAAFISSAQEAGIVLPVCLGLALITISTIVIFQRQLSQKRTES